MPTTAIYFESPKNIALFTLAVAYHAVASGVNKVEGAIKDGLSKLNPFSSECDDRI